MPNWCENILTIEDCSPELDQYIQDNGFSFEKILPTPTDLLEGDGWYDWRVANWGTKWDLDEREQQEVKEQLLDEHSKYKAVFMTAWSPPCQAIAALSKQFPNDRFTLHYLEFGMGFAGTAHIHNGISIEDDMEDNDEVNRFAADVFGYDYDELTEEQNQ